MDAVMRIEANRGGYALMDYGDLYDVILDEDGKVIGEIYETSAMNRKGERKSR